MKDGEVVTTFSPQLQTRRLEVNASPMLDLIELRYCEPDGTIAAEYVDRDQARKLALMLNLEAAALEAAWEGVEAAPGREETGAA